MKTVRNEKIVKLRVIAILLVVIGHSIIIFTPGWNTYQINEKNEILTIIKKFINIIQMPLFIMIYGFLYNKTCEKHTFNEIFVEKLKRIIIPFVCITIFWMVPIRYIAKYPYYSAGGYLTAVINCFLGKDSGHLWYLPTLFILFILTYMINKISYEKIVKIGSIILLFILSIFSVKLPTICFLSQICEYLIYFYIGFLYNKIDKNNKVLNIICGILFVTLSFMVVFVVNDINLNRIFVILAGITGTYALYGLCSNNESTKLIKALDKNSFVIYLLHSPLIYIMYSRFSNINPLLLISCNIAIAITIPIFIAIILRKIKINFIIGEKIK